MLTTKCPPQRSLATTLITTSDKATFKYYRTNTDVLVKVFTDRLEFYYQVKKELANTPSYIVLASDLVGIRVTQEIISKKNNQIFLEIYAYPMEKGSSEMPSKRKRQMLKLMCSKSANFEENLSMAHEWCSIVSSVLPSRADQVKPFLFYVNPISGAGKAQSIFQKCIVPVLIEANIPYELVLTKHTKFCSEHIKDLELSSYSGVIVVSGDGLIYEVFNGLMSRSDWRDAIKMPIAQIPGGSANALACCACYLAKESFRNLSLENFATSMTFSLVKSEAVPLDLMRIQLCDGSVVGSFLSLEWAFIADLDLESERYRFMGDMRFTVGALPRILNLRLYRGRISFLPADDMADYTPKDPSLKLTRTTHSVAPISDQFTYLPDMNSDLPCSWLTIENEFILFLIVNLPLISPDFLASPHATFNDGNMHMLFMKAGATKAQLLKVLTQPGDKHHLDNPLIEFVRIKAFRLEPLGQVGCQGNKGVMMVDGEQVPYGKIQGEICPGMGNILTHKA